MNNQRDIIRQHEINRINPIIRSMRKYLKDKNKQTQSFAIQNRKQIQNSTSNRKQSQTRVYKNSQSSIHSNNYLSHVKVSKKSKREKISRNVSSVDDGYGSDGDMGQCTDDNLIGQTSIDESDLQKLSQVIKRLVLKNKLNAKNAFDVPLIDVTCMGAIKKNDDTAWSKISSVLENSSKVYSFRVDSIADSVNKMTNNISRSQKTHDIQFTQKIKQERQKNRHDQQFLTNELLSFAEQCQLDQMYTKHLQKQKINQTSDKNKSDINPFHQSIRRMFDQNGISGMLLGRLNITSRLNIVVDVGIQYQIVKNQQNSKYQDIIEAGKYSTTKKISIFQDVGLLKNICFPTQEKKQIIQDCTNLNFEDQPDMYVLNDDNGQIQDLLFETMRDSQGYQQKVGKLSEESQSVTNFQKNNKYLQQSSLNISKLSNFSIIIQPFEQNLQKKKNRKKKAKEQNKNQPKIKRQRVKKQELVIDFKEQKALDKKSIMSSNQSLNNDPNNKKQKTKQKNIIKKLIPQFNISFETNFIPILQQDKELNNYVSSQEDRLIKEDFVSNHFSHMSMNSMQEGLFRIPNIKSTKKYLWQIIQKTAQTTISQLHQRYQKQKGSVSQTIIFLSVLHLGNENNLLISEGQNYEIEVKNPFVGE